jgi:hypothetical protein
MVCTLAPGMLHPRALIPVVTALALALAGCTTTGSSNDSSGKFQGTQRLVANTVEDFESAAKKGDNGQICRNLLSRALVARYAKAQGTCEKGVDEAVKDSDTQDLTVQGVRLSGTTAATRVKVENGGDDRIQAIGLIREGGGWRIATFG